MTAANVTTALSDLTKNLIYISESESPVTLLQWDAASLEDLLTNIATFTGTPQASLEITAPADFFAGVQRMADPNDEVMMKYAKDYQVLQDFLTANLDDLRVIKAGNIQVHIFLTGFTKSEKSAVVLHTIAIHT